MTLVATLALPAANPVDNHRVNLEIPFAIRSSRSIQAIPHP